MPIPIEVLMALATRSKSSIGKAALGRALFDFARIDRIHIIACRRSGTTMWHLALARFIKMDVVEFRNRYPTPRYKGIYLATVSSPAEDCPDALPMERVKDNFEKLDLQ